MFDDAIRQLRPVQRSSRECGDAASMVDRTRASLQARDPSVLRRCLSALPDGPRQALALAVFEGMDPADIAVRLGQDVGSVKTWLLGAADRLRSP